VLRPLVAALEVGRGKAWVRERLLLLRAGVLPTPSMCYFLEIALVQFVKFAFKDVS
jgi:hypothetical protein